MFVCYQQITNQNPMQKIKSDKNPTPKNKLGVFFYIQWYVWQITAQIQYKKDSREEEKARGVLLYSVVCLFVCLSNHSTNPIQKKRRRKKTC